MPQKFYYSKTLQKYSLVLVGNLFHGFGKSKFPDSKMDCKFCSLQSSEGEDYKDMKKFILVQMFSGFVWKPITSHLKPVLCLWSIQIPELSVNFALFYLSKKKITKSRKSSYGLPMLSGLVWKPITFTRPDADSQVDSFKGAS